MGVAVGGAIAAAVVGMDTANAGTNDFTSVLVASLGDVSAVAEQDLAALTADLPGSAAFSSATLTDAQVNLVEAAAISTQSKTMGYLGRLDDAQDNISTHTGSLAPVFENLLFDPLGQYWLSISERVLTADHGFADAYINDLGSMDIALAHGDMTMAGLELVGAGYLSLPIIYFSDFLDLFGG